MRKARNALALFFSALDTPPGRSPHAPRPTGRNPAPRKALTARNARKLVRQ